MPVIVSVHPGNIHGTDHLSGAIIAVQTALGGTPINRSIDRQSLAQQIIVLQKKLNSLGKFPANQISTTIDDQQLAAKLAQVEAAANT